MSKAVATPEIKAQERDFTLNPRQLRANQIIPATVYGKEFGPYSIQLPQREFTYAYNHGKRSFTFDGIGGKSVTVKAHQIQRNPVTDEILSVEFLYTDK